MKRQYHEPETYSRQEVRAMQEACTQKVAETRRNTFLEAAEIMDDGAKDCREKVNHPFTASVLEGFSAQFRAKAEEQ